MDNFLVLGIVVAVIAVAFIAWRVIGNRRPVPEALRVGRTLPDFDAEDEHGTAVRSADLRGAPTVMLFVRGNWCPFCTSQVKNLTKYYKEIGDEGARLIFVTPKPLDTTRRVAEFFEVDFDFWLDPSLEIAKSLDLFLPGGVPKSHEAEYGNDTVWPTALVVDGNGTIVYASLSKFIADRPDPKHLLDALRRIS